MDVTKATATLRRTHISLLIRWLSKPKQLSREELDECVWALMADGIDESPDLAAQAVQAQAVIDPSARHPLGVLVFRRNPLQQPTQPAPELVHARNAAVQLIIFPGPKQRA